MKCLIIYFGIGGIVAGYYLETNLATSGYVGRKIADTNSNNIPNIWLGADRIADWYPHLSFPVEYGPGPQLSGSIRSFKVDLKKDGRNPGGVDINR